MEVPGDDWLLEPLAATLLIFRMEIIMPALPPGRAIMDAHSDKGWGTHPQSPGRLGDMTHKGHFHMLPLKIQFPLQCLRVESIYRNTFCTWFQEGPLLHCLWPLAPRPCRFSKAASSGPAQLPASHRASRCLAASSWKRSPPVSSKKLLRSSISLEHHFVTCFSQ